ncbi:DUF6786 family protein [Prevotella sp. 10(H)]|uniref:DUF6786 family protein n=1 Tax=Prevotella sp. 10(H) TaxID=1158294 RepID=UPI0004A7100E|nr:DUF6786 family protein [Prevotella sp. 10(H)]
MSKINPLVAIILASGLLFSCSNKNTKKEGKETAMETYEKGTFGYDLNYLSSKDSLIILKGDNDKAQVIISPKYQAKVFTSTVDGLSGKSTGFVGYKAFELTTPDEHMNGYGGENRFWLGPEGGKYSVYFEKGKEQVYDNWHTPKPIDIEPWNLVSATAQKAVMSKEMEVANYFGIQLKLNVDRTVEFLNSARIKSLLDIELGENVKSVAYSTQNVITNKNDFEWTKQTGTISTWILDMFIPAPKAVTIIPFNEGDEKALGKIVTSDYFGEIPADRLVTKNNTLYFKTDGAERGKLGLNSNRTTGVAGNYDPDSKRLTITTFDVERSATYLNQEWNPTKDPLIGDAMNAYNDGPLADGSIMGPFLEVESCSPAAFLKPNESQSHNHNVFHFVGEPADLSKITEKVLGVSVNDILNAFK